jgi:hypothetical protein
MVGLERDTENDMADIIDEANQREEELRAKALAKRKPAGPPPCGACYNCDEPLAPGLRWCDTECRADWERAQEVERSKAGRYYDED